MQQKVLNDRYELERKIGEGGMARVYLGRDLRLNRRVAIKVLHSQYAGDPNFLGRFNHEAQAAANLRHPNIIDIYDVGQDGDVQYIVMEFVEGQDLKALLRLNGPLPIDRAVYIAEEIANGLDAAHRAGLIHRDIKPQNIIIGPNERVKITDFGIAKSALSTSATETGVIFGTADYLSPEQARGLPATLVSDVYSLGITLYEMLTGRLPFTGDNSVAVAMQHVSTPPPPPSRFNPRIPQQLEQIILGAIEKDPARRPTSARAFAQQLQAYTQQGDQGTVVRPQPQAPRMPVVPATDTMITIQAADGRPQPQPRPRPQPSAPLPQRSQLPPRASVPTPRSSSGIGFGSFILGLLLIVGVLGLIGLVASGALSDLLPKFTLPTSQPQPIPTVPVTPITGTAVPLATVPNVLNLDQQGAAAVITGAGLTPQEAPARNSESVPVGRVIDQLPLAGQQITQTSVVTYALSLGPVIIAVPDLSRVSQSAAEAQIRSLGLVPNVQQQVSADIPKGFVISQNPPVGFRVSPGDSVTIVVSTGNDVSVPDVFKLPLDQARQKLEAVGLIVGDINYQGRDKLGDQFDQFQPNTIVSTDPQAGKTVTRGTVINLGVRAE